MKDPAMLWYWNDWQGGTATLTRHLKGCYMDLLNAQFNNGKLSLSEIRTGLGADFAAVWPTLSKKFKEEDGLFFNARLQVERDRRAAFTESRRNNASGAKPPPEAYAEHMQQHMENENVNRDLNPSGRKKKVPTGTGKKELLDQRALEFKLRLVEFKTQYPTEMLHRFYNYWTEPNKTETKMRFELNKTWDLKRRLDYWANNDKDFNHKNTNHAQTGTVKRGKADTGAIREVARQILERAGADAHGGGGD